MGYVPPTKLLRLKFAGTDWDGLEVHLQPMPMGELMRLETIFAKPGLAGLSEAAAMLADNIAAWNVEEPDGTPVIPNLDGIKRQDKDMVMAVLRAWQDGVATVAAPLPEGSGSGETSPVSLIPMTPLGSDSSQSLAS